jgi:Trypsin-like peptidase domain
MRHVTYSVIRQRPMMLNDQQGLYSAARGTGFLVSPEIFVTCNHVINAVEDPHQVGDQYALVANMGVNIQTRVATIVNPKIGSEINLFPAFDLAILRVPPEAGRQYASLSFNHVYEGEEIGVAGYPIARLLQSMASCQLTV